jgi:hypothetical protein
MQETITQIGEFLDALFEKDDLIEVRMLPSGRREWKKASEFSEDFLNHLKHHNLDGQNIYFGANPRGGKGSSSQDVATCNCLFVDFDNVSIEYARKIVSSGSLPMPTVEIASGHGVHFYWRLEEPIEDTELWSSYMRGLIAVCESDHKIKDPARIMRLPGFLNVKYEPHTECKILAIRPGAVYDIVEMPVDPLQTITPSPTATPREIETGESEPHPATLYFMKKGAPAGERNSRMFSSACDLSGRGYTEQQCMEMLLRPAMNSGLSPAEVEVSIKSAFSKPRMPREEDSDTIESCLQRMVHGTEEEREKASQTGRGFRPTIVNIADIGTGDESRRCYISAPKIFELIQEANEGYPRRVGSILFAECDPPPSGVLPTAGSIRYISNEAALFAYLMRECDIRWSNRECVDRETNAKRNPATKKEMYEFSSAEAKPQYKSVELLPHYPQIDGVYYAQCELPEPTGKALDELVSHFNPETEIDRQLMIAALVTPAWGGDCGARPAFVFTSTHGRGVGKTTTASLICDIWGGAPSITEREDWESVRARLLSDEALSQRCVLIDNLKTRLSRSGLEGAITATTIDGKKMYKGQFSRPNNLTWFITANSPSLSRDLAERSIIIKLGEAQHASDFADWRNEFFKNKRAELISDIIDWLSREKNSKLKSSSLDRWSSWQRAILERFPNSNEVAEHYQKRRPEVDCDLEEAEEVAATIRNLIIKNGHDPDFSVVKIPKKILFQELRFQDIIDGTMSPKGCTTWIKNLQTLEPMKYMSPFKHTGVGRCWLWMGENADPNEKPKTLDDFSLNNDPAPF